MFTEIKLMFLQEQQFKTKNMTQKIQRMRKWQIYLAKCPRMQFIALEFYRKGKLFPLMHTD